MKVSRAAIESLVRDALLRRLQPPGSAGADAASPDAGLDFVSEEIVRAAAPAGFLRIQGRAIVTPLAREAAERLGVRLVAADGSGSPGPAPRGGRTLQVALGADHRGFEAKRMVGACLDSEAGLVVLDMGCSDPGPADYPEYAHRVAARVARGEASFGVLFDGTGFGSCMAANRYRGVRAALLRDPDDARNCRSHNDANVACLPGGLDPLLIQATVLTFLATPFQGGRHARRVARIEIA